MGQSALSSQHSNLFYFLLYHFPFLVCISAQPRFMISYSVWRFFSLCILHIVIYLYYNLMYIEHASWQLYKLMGITIWMFHSCELGVFGLKEVGGRKEMRKYNWSLRYLSKHRKRKIRTPFFLFYFLFYTTISSLLECYS